MKKETHNKKQVIKQMPKKVEKPAVVKIVAKKAAVIPAKTKQTLIIAVPKKQVTQKVGQKPKLVVAPDHQRFWVNNGPVLKDLKELHDALLKMSKEQFKHHTQKQNDFSLWVEIVLLDKKCAAALKKAKTQKGAAEAVAETLKKIK